MTGASHLILLLGAYGSWLVVSYTCKRIWRAING